LFWLCSLSQTVCFCWRFRRKSNKPPTQFRATKFEIRNSQPGRGGKLYITVPGRERKLYDEPIEAWIINDGRQVVFSSHDGAGGFENEGQSLRIYDVKTRRTRKILSEHVFVTAVQSVRLRTGAIALLVKMGDGGLGWKGLFRDARNDHL
jgi:hypothetical protein